MKRRSTSLRTFLNNQYGVKPNGEPDVDIDDLLAKAKAKNNGKKTITLDVTPYPDEILKNAEEILADEE